MTLAFGDVILQTDDLLEEAPERSRQKLQQNPEVIPTLYRHAGLQRRLGLLEDARSTYELITRLDPDVEQARYMASALSLDEVSTQPLPDDAPMVFHRSVDFFPSEQTDELWRIIEDDSTAFSPAIVGEDNVNIADRQAGVLPVCSLDSFFPGFRKKIDTELERCWHRMWPSQPQIKRCEYQITRHQSGEFYKLHKDNGDEGTASTRDITFVYYFFKEPRTFSGGDLIMVDRVLNQAGSVGYTGLPPINNSLILFPSSTLHQVSPVEWQVYTERLAPLCLIRVS